MKHYTPGDEARLIDEVERQGGKHLTQACMADEVEELRRDASGKSLGAILTTGCEETARFQVPYDATATVLVHEPVLEPDPSPDAPSSRKRAKTDDDGFVLYEVVEHSVPEGSVKRPMRNVIACANDDLMRNWPRFQRRMKKPDPLTGNR